MYNLKTNITKNWAKQIKPITPNLFWLSSCVLRSAQYVATKNAMLEMVEYRISIHWNVLFVIIPQREADTKKDE